MRITAIAREDLSNICNGLIPNEIHLELKGMIVPDSYGEHIGQYDIENQEYESYFKKDHEAGNTGCFDAYRSGCNCIAGNAQNASNNQQAQQPKPQTSPDGFMSADDEGLPFH